MRIIFAAGGTGGHINPALAVAREVKNRLPGAGILFVGAKEKMEEALVPKAGFDFKSIDISGFQRSSAPADILFNLKTIKKLLFVTGQCKKILADFKPDIVVGFGGYASGPVVRTAHRSGIKTAIHEQNAFPGKTNIILSKYADAVMLSDVEAKKYLKCGNAVITGLPVRSEILTADREEARKKLGITPDKKVILSTGGSLGAEALNAVMCEIIPRFAGKNFVFVHGSGKNGVSMLEKLKNSGIDVNSSDIRVSEYIYDMAEYMAAADLVISRAGASSLAEIKVLGKPSLLIPYPSAAENHQYYNALTLADTGAAFLVEQKNLSADRVSDIIDELSEKPEKFREMGRRARLLAVCNAEKRICDILFSLV